MSWHQEHHLYDPCRGEPERFAPGPQDRQGDIGQYVQHGGQGDQHDQFTAGILTDHQGTEPGRQ